VRGDVESVAGSGADAKLAAGVVSVVLLASGAISATTLTPTGTAVQTDRIAAWRVRKLNPAYSSPQRETSVRPRRFDCAFRIDCLGTASSTPPVGSPTSGKPHRPIRARTLPAGSAWRRAVRTMIAAIKPNCAL